MDEHLIGAAQPFGTTKATSYQMVTHRYTGRVLYVMFRTQTDLRRWVPAPLQVADPHEAFVKVYQLKRRPIDRDPDPPAFSGYHEVCVTVLATLPDDPTPRHYNLFMWLDRDWPIYKYREVFGWPKKLAQIDISSTFAGDGRYDYDDGTQAYGADLHRHGFRLMTLRAQLAGGPEAPTPPFAGFYTVRHLVSPDGDPDGHVSELLTIQPTDGWTTPPVFGTAELSFGTAPDEELDALGDVEVTGCALMDTGWVLPAWPARRVASLPELAPQVGEPAPADGPTRGRQP
ncbi:MAG: hypothetical protein GEU93_19005 [Propionibacteriales bacterium]|nr:hypothetical protein [Propionibacteriales bacterium]